MRVNGAQPVPGRGAGLVFQAPRLLPWKTVGGNVELALRYAGVPREDRPARVGELLERVGLPDVANRRTWQISGGPAATGGAGAGSGGTESVCCCSTNRSPR
ncbi:hypothetical protein GCM10020218_049390 [Dactylosporangium vinaceum]